MEKMSVSLEAPAKINLFLDVLSRRSDGYHNIKSIMQTISLCDTINISLASANSLRINLSCSESSLPTDTGNIAYRAAELYFSQLQSSGYSVNIDITKRIPVCAGLAGGSADAAAVLVGLNTLMGEPLSLKRLCAMGASLGADLPFCILKGTKTAEGIGDILSDCTAPPELLILVAAAGESVSTPSAYSALDKLYNNFAGYLPNSKGYDAMKNALSSGDAAKIANSLYNIFEDVILPSHSSARTIKELMSANGAAGVLMSGSGPSVFGIFQSETDINSAERALSSLGIKSHICKSI